MMEYWRKNLDFITHYSNIPLSLEILYIGLLNRDS
jgi:hypothetical protein